MLVGNTSSSFLVHAETLENPHVRLARSGEHERSAYLLMPADKTVYLSDLRV